MHFQAITGAISLISMLEFQAPGSTGSKDRLGENTLDRMTSYCADSDFFDIGQFSLLNFDGSMEIRVGFAGLFFWNRLLVILEWKSDETKCFQRQPCSLGFPDFWKTLLNAPPLAH
jgi:hypothetical protein